MLRGKVPTAGFVKKHGRKNAGQLVYRFLIFAPSPVSGAAVYE